MKQSEILIHNVAMFRMKHPQPSLDSIEMEPETYKKFMTLIDAEFYEAAKRMDKASFGELFGVKIYIDDTVPVNKAKLLLRGITVGEVFVTNPMNSDEGERKENG